MQEDIPIKIPIDRRLFLKASLLTAASVLIQPEKVLASFSSSADKQPSGRLKLYSINTGEKIDVTYRHKGGHYNTQAIKDLNWLLRCHYTDQEHPIDIKTLEFLDLIHTRLDCENEIHVICGYRSPKYNNYLRKRSRNVAKHSLHMEGRALDIRIPGIALSKLKRTALSLRMGGVGYYPRSNFIHIDSGVFRTW